MYSHNGDSTSDVESLQVSRMTGDLIGLLLYSHRDQLSPSRWILDLSERIAFPNPNVLTVEVTTCSSQTAIPLACL